MGEPTADPSLRIEKLCRKVYSVRKDHYQLCEEIKPIANPSSATTVNLFNALSLRLSSEKIMRNWAEKIEEITLAHHYKTQKEKASLIETAYRILRLHEILKAHPAFMFLDYSEHQAINLCTAHDDQHINGMFNNFVDQTNYLRSLWGGTIHVHRNRDVAYEQSINLDFHLTHLERLKSQFENFRSTKEPLSLDKYLLGIFNFRMDYAEKVLSCLSFDLQKIRELLLIVGALKAAESTSSIKQEFYATGYPQPLPSLNTLSRGLLLGINKASINLKGLEDFIDRLLDMGQGDFETGSFRIAHYVAAPLSMPPPYLDKPKVPRFFEESQFPLTFRCASGKTLNI